MSAIPASSADPRPAVGEARQFAVSVGLSFTAGFVDTCGFIALFGLFTAHVTGNFVLIGAELVGPSGGLLTKLLALPTFVVVVALTRLAVARLEAAGRPVLRVLLFAQASLLLAFMASGIAVSPPVRADAWPELATGLLGVAAMAVQNAKARLLLSSYTPTTVMTGNVTQIVIDVVDLLRPGADALRPQVRQRLRKMAPPVVGFAIGAVLGAFGYASLGFACLLLPVLILLGLALGTRSH